MRIQCEVQISNRKLPSHNLSSSLGSKRSLLGIGRHPGSTTDVASLFIHLCTPQNKQGTKYKIKDNIMAVFTKFVSQGKFTVRFKEPEHDLCVKSDPVLAKSFLQTLKQGLLNKDIDKLRLSCLAPAKNKQVERPKTKLIISGSRDYAVTALPYTLNSLRVEGAQLTKVGDRIMKLKKLKVLDLPSNHLETVPASLSKMHCLSELHLPKNRLTTVDPNTFTGNMCLSLQLLDLSSNQIKHLPKTLGTLHNLSTLKLDFNNLTQLPLTLGKLSKLRYLSVSHNVLSELPASMRYLSLDSLDVFSNPLSQRLGIVKNGLRMVRSLKEIAAAACTKQGLQLTAADVPATVVSYLRTWQPCLCGNVCYEHHITAIVPLDLKLISSTLTVNSVYNNMQYTVPACATLCSQTCFNKYWKW